MFVIEELSTCCTSFKPVRGFEHIVLGHVDDDSM